MTLTELTDHAIIQTLKGSKWRVCKADQKCYNINGDGSYIRFDNLNEDLSHKTSPACDVVSVRYNVSYDVTEEIVRT